MTQIFQPSTNTIARVTILGGVFILAAVTGVAAAIYRSSYFTGVDIPVEQPVPFSHKHHVGGLGLDCRYCHTGVEDSSFAGIPSTSICMKCHSRVWTQSPMLEPVRSSLRTNQPLRWLRVDDLPDYVYFDHSIHVHEGVGCVVCHGRVDEMPLTWKAESLHMGWCLDCHRHPDRYLRPREEVFNLQWEPPADQQALGARLAEDYGVQSTTDCYTCHR